MNDIDLFIQHLYKTNNMCAILNKRFSLKRIELSLKRLFNVIKLIGTNTAVFIIALQFIDHRPKGLGMLTVHGWGNIHSAG